MAHYAFLNENNIVTEVIYGIDENELIDGQNPEIWYQNFKQQICKRTSYSGKIRGNYAAKDFIYFVNEDIFMPPKCHEIATLDAKTAKWDCEDPSHKELINANN